MRHREQSRARPPARRADVELEDLAARLVRLAPSSRDPERFHVEKHTLAAEIRRVAAEIRRAS